jgi:hypothetical protein
MAAKQRETPVCRHCAMTAYRIPDPDTNEFSDANLLFFHALRMKAAGDSFTMVANLFCTLSFRACGRLAT